MATTLSSKVIAEQQQLLVTLDDSVDITNVKRAIKMLRGVISISRPKSTKAACLYDPETGKKLNSKTMKAIEDARQGKDIAFTGTADEFKEWAKML